MGYQAPWHWFSRRMKRVMKQRHESFMEPDYDAVTGKIKSRKVAYTFGISLVMRFKGGPPFRPQKRVFASHFHCTCENGVLGRLTLK